MKSNQRFYYEKAGSYAKSFDFYVKRDDFYTKANEFYTKSLTFDPIYDILIPVHIS